MIDDLDAQIRELVARLSASDTAGLEPDDDLVERLGIDSLQGLQILAAVEKRFDIRLPDDELQHLRTLRRIAHAVERGTEGRPS